jgi:predicted ester cyclase
MRARYSGAQAGQMGPFPPSGERFEIPYIGILRFADGIIAEIWVEWDNLSALTQLGHRNPPNP